MRAPPGTASLDPRAPAASPPLADDARRVLLAWAGLALSALALAGVFALLLALSRTPGIERILPWPVDFFHKGLVIHVVFSFDVWFLAVAGALMAIAARSPGGAARRALGLAAPALFAVASVLLFVPAFLDRGEPSLNNYVPAIIDPLYYAGLAALGGGIGLAALAMLTAVAGGLRLADAATAAVAAAAGAILSALASALLALRALWGETPSHAFNEQLFWGAGHVLQFANVALMLAAWRMLAGAVWGGVTAGETVLRIAALWLFGFALVGPALYVLFPPFAAEQTEAFTNLQYALAPPVVAAALVFGREARARSAGGLPWRHPAFLCLALSAAVFAVGGVLGLFVDGTDTRTPAHYHGVIAGVNLAFMGLFYVVFLPGLGRALAWGRILYAQIWMFALGQTAAALGLFLAGGYGAPRKVAGAAQDLASLGEIAGMAINGLGALVAVAGGVLFIWTAGRALLGGAEARPGGSPRAARSAIES